MIKPAFLSLLFVAALAATAHAETNVAVAADVYGLVAVADAASAKPEDRWPVQLLQCFPARKVLYLEKEARAILFFPVSGSAFELRGPGRFEIASDSVQPLSRAPAPSKTVLNTAFRGIKLDRTNLAPAGVRMRDPKLAGAPIPMAPRGVVTSSGAPIFRWEAAGAGKSYRFRLVRTRKDLIYETLTDQMELQLPADIALSPGERLLWQVQDASSDRGAAAWQEFVIATPEVRALATQLDQALPSPTSAERNLREALLMQQMPP